MDGQVYSNLSSGVEIISDNPNPTLADLNKRAIKKLYELINALEPKSDPDMVRACVESLSKFNSSLKGSNILPQEETAEQKAERLSAEAIKEALNGD